MALVTRGLVASYLEAEAGIDAAVGLDERDSARVRYRTAARELLAEMRRADRLGLLDADGLARSAP